MLGVGGAFAVAARNRARADTLTEEVQRANDLLAAARADDRGWDLQAMLAVARTELADRAPAFKDESLHLVEVIDKPGIDGDRAVFRAHAGRDAVEIELARRESSWVVVA